jgi:hypothetical protein
VPITIDKLLENPRSKIQRANRHIEELKRRTNPLDRDLYEIVSAREPLTIIHRYATQYRVTFRAKQNIPKALGAIIGDAVGNVREAFDHLASSIVGTWGTRPQRLYFPITERTHLQSHAGLAAMEQALPGFAKLLLDTIRPANGPDEPFWEFYKLGNNNKHNDFIPLVTVVSINNINATIGSNLIADCGVRFNVTIPSVLFDSAVPITIQSTFQTAVEVLFADGTPFKSDPVIPTLSKISDLASDTVERVGDLARQVKGVK